MKNETDQLSGGPKLTEWKKEPRVQDLKADLEASKPAQQAKTQQIEKWNSLREVTGVNRPKPVKGRSSVQPKLIRRQAEWRYSALSEPFLSSEKLYDVTPRTFEDMDSAKQNDIVINWQFDTQFNKVKFIDEYVRTTVDEGTAIVRLGWKRETRTEKVMKPVFQYTEPETQEEIDFLTQAIELNTENHNEYLDLPEELRAAVDYMLETEQPSVATIVGEEEVEEEKVVENRPTIGIMRPENVFIDPACEGDYEKADFIIASFETSKAELSKDKRHKNLDKVNWGSESILASPDHATSTPSSFESNNDLKRKVVAYEYWGYSDIYDDGVLHPIVATWIGDVMIRMEENPFPDGKPPFVVVPYLPIKREVYGEPDAEILEDNQKILGAITRGMIDLMGRSANSQQGFAKGFLDVTNRRKFDAGKDYEFNQSAGDPRLATHQHTYPEIPNSALTMVQLQNQEAEALSGVKSFSGGVSGEGYGDVAAGIKGVLDASSKREMNILRRLAKGIQDIGTKMMAMNAVFMSEKEIIRITNEEFVEIRREDLKGNFDLKVDISTPEIDEQKATDLGFMLQTIGPNMDFNLQKMILVQISRLKRMPTLAKEIEKFEPQPDPVQEEIKQLEVAKLKKEIEELDSKIMLNMAKASETKADAVLKNTEAENNMNGENHRRDMQKQSEQARGNQSLEVTKGLLKPLKEGEKSPNVGAAIGFNELSRIGSMS